MAVVCLQKAHCWRKTGSTGTTREQEYASTVCDRLADLLEERGHTVHVVLADPANREYPQSDVTIATHLNGFTPDANGVEAFHPIHPGYDATRSNQLAQVWLKHHVRLGYPGRVRGINTLGGAVRDTFYGWRDDRHPDDRYRSGAALLTEALFATNPAEYDWLWHQGGLEICAQSHLYAIGDVFGHPNEVPAAPEKEKWTMNRFVYAERDGVKTASYLADGIIAVKVTPAEQEMIEAAAVFGAFPLAEKIRVGTEYLDWMRRNAGSDPTPSDAHLAAISNPDGSLTLTVQ